MDKQINKYPQQCIVKYIKNRTFYFWRLSGNCLPQRSFTFQTHFMLLGYSKYQSFTLNFLKAR